MGQNKSVQREESIRRLNLLAQGFDNLAAVQTAAGNAATKFGVSQTQANKEFAQGVTNLEEVATGKVGQAADTLADGAPTNIEAQLADPLIQSANATRDDLINARSALLDAENASGKAFDENAFVNGVNVLKETSPSLTGASNAARTANLNMADNLIEAFTSSKNAYTEQFNNLPDGIGFDVEGLTEIMTRLKANTGDFGEITSNAYKQDPIATMLAMLSPQKTGVDTVPEIIPERS